MLASAHSHAREWGRAGQRQALLLHCSNAHSGSWSGVAEQLQGRLHLRAVDLPGHGRAPDWDETQDFHSQATAMARSALDAPVDLIGHSMGATVALRIACETPELVRSLTLIEPVFFAAAKEAGSAEFARHWEDFQPFVAAVKEGCKEQAAAAFTAIWGTGQVWLDLPQNQRSFICARIHLIVAAVPQIYHDRAGVLAGNKLEALSMPVRLIRGQESPAIIADIHAALLARMPFAQEGTIMGARHMAPVTHAMPVAQEISTFLF